MVRIMMINKRELINIKYQFRMKVPRTIAESYLLDKYLGNPHYIYAIKK